MQDADIDRAARQIRVRPHARETIKTALQLGWHVHVLSVNWSAALIRCVLAGLPSRIETDAGDNVEAEGPGQAVVIHANSLEMQLGISTGASPSPHTHRASLRFKHTFTLSRISVITGGACCEVRAVG